MSRRCGPGDATWWGVHGKIVTTVYRWHVDPDGSKREWHTDPACMTCGGSGIYRYPGREDTSCHCGHYADDCPQAHDA